MNYEDFLRAKVATAPARGREISTGTVNPILKPHQRAIVPWMVRGGRRALLPVTFMLLQPTSWHPDVWTDITRMRTLNGAQSAKGKEMHLCPLQFDIVDRLIVQLSQPDELVLDPFAGLGTVPQCALKLKRQALGFELSARYFADAVGYCESAVRKLATPTLFDLTEESPASDSVPA